MDRSNILTLVKETKSKNEYGVWETKEETTDVYCNVQSVTASEFFDGGRNGLNPEYRFTIFYADYEGEKTVEFQGKRYGVYRVYHARTDEMELYVERKGGTNG